MSYSVPQSAPFDDNGDISQDTTPGGDVEARWEIVSKTSGLMPAQIQAGRLQAEGILARAWQEAAGQALGLMVGLLGTGYVAVPAEFVARAQAILAEPVAMFEQDEELDRDGGDFEEE
ncbi:MAG: hypothetical protein KC443_23310 [Anaerolineales bacterium]|nr:hypothetical protein [Anaerolineales bacterium]